ncbi:nucleoside triphosphate pyrophosphohydrolase [Spirochaetia bacterium 38H-sp]|uniref:Nucleoside triphosphate pyrophosphohydrolase n=1 Tax=Rarispira pelagica TaxID=3141764 RepID=A0ABU9UAN7_9SPIR
MNNSPIEELKSIIETLRGPNGCPWDKKQTPMTMLDALWEEVAELNIAIVNSDIENIEEEIGDVILVLFMIIQIYKEQSQLDYENIFIKLNNKLIRRHPHVFGKEKASTAEEALTHWNKEKRKEKKAITNNLLDFLNNDFENSFKSPYILTYVLQEKLSQIGFDWEDSIGPLNKIKEEILEIEHEFNKDNKNKENLSTEIGDLIFSVINFSRKEKISPEKSLLMTLKKIKKRFIKMHQLNPDFENLDLKSMDTLWNISKNAETDDC